MNPIGQAFPVINMHLVVPPIKVILTLFTVWPTRRLWLLVVVCLFSYVVPVPGSSFSAYGDDANLGGRGEGGGNLRVARVGVGS